MRLSRQHLNDGCHGQRPTGVGRASVSGTSSARQHGRIAALVGHGADYASFVAPDESTGCNQEPLRGIWSPDPTRIHRASLLAAVFLLSLPGCAYFQSEIVDPPPMNDPFAPAPVWGGTTNVFGTPTWSSGSNNFTMPAWGGPPPLYGTRLGLPPGESPAAKALALTEQLTAAKSENEQLTTRLRGLEAEVAASNQALARATTEVVETRTELAHARTDLEQWKQEVASLREKLVAAEKENLSTLQSTVGLVQQLMTQEQQPAEGE